MATYAPRLATTPEGLEQQFEANVTHAGPGLIALGELKPRPGKALKLGTPIHSLMFFERDDHKPKRLGALRVAMKPTPAQLKKITSMLRAAAGDKLEVTRPTIRGSRPKPAPSRRRASTRVASKR